MKRSPERTAWTVLFAALFVCIALSVGVPAATMGYINNATENAFMRISLQSGILKTYSPIEAESDARVVDLAGREFKEEHTVVAGDRSVGLLTFALRDGVTPTLRVQLYANARVQAIRARVPRFGPALAASAAGDELTLELTEGRIDVIALDDSRPFRLQINSTHAVAVVTAPGVYTFDATLLHLLVQTREGAAQIQTPNGSVLQQMQGYQVARFNAAEGARVLAPANNLVRNGFFLSTLGRDWQFSTRVGEGETVRGTVSRFVNPASGKGQVLFERVGNPLGWGRTTLTQTVGENVSGRSDLRLRMAFDILEQDLDVCGGEGTECPLLVRIDFQTSDGRDDYWLQGFYARGNPASNLPDYVRSNFKGNHIAKPINTLAVVESENLLEPLGKLLTITSISLYAEGHGLRTRVRSVELLLRD